MTGGNKWRLLVFSCQTSGATGCGARDFKLFFENLKCCNCCHKSWPTEASCAGEDTAGTVMEVVTNPPGVLELDHLGEGRTEKLEQQDNKEIRVQ